MKLFVKIVIFGFLLTMSACSSISAKDQRMVETALAVILKTAAATPRSPTQPAATGTAVPPTETKAPTAQLTMPAVVGTPQNAALPDCVAGGQAVQAQVVRIVDGDTIKVNLNGIEVGLRYIGMDTPENTTQVEYYGFEASEKNRQMVAGQQVTLFKDVSETDRYGRLLRYVFVGDKFVNYELVRQGFANAITYPPDVACADLFARAEEEARRERVGFWAVTFDATPTPALPPTATVASLCPQGCTQPPLSCEIKGNINSEGEKIYHLPGSPAYISTQIDTDKGELWFCTEEEALANGWRAVKR